MKVINILLLHSIIWGEQKKQQINGIYWCITTYGANLIRSCSLWAQQESCLRLDMWILHSDRIAVRLATIVDFQLHRPYYVRIDHRQVRHLHATTLWAPVDLHTKKYQKTLLFRFWFYIVWLPPQNGVKVVNFSKHKHNIELCVTNVCCVGALWLPLVLFLWRGRGHDYIQLHNNCKVEIFPSAKYRNKNLAISIACIWRWSVYDVHSYVCM